MDERIQAMLARYSCNSKEDYLNALKEIIQEIALLGLWRSKFFERAAFYGGTALRILYGLDRFSEDLDFSLLKVEPEFNLSPYNEAVSHELRSFGFTVSVETKIKTRQTFIQSAFIKENTKNQFIAVAVPTDIIKCLHGLENIKIKMEVDINPPGNFLTEAKVLLQPIPFSVNTFQQPDLFAGKLHAILCRQWQTRVKGRDWYDLVWFVKQNIPVRLAHLRERLIESQALRKNEPFDRAKVIELLQKKIAEINFQQAQQDVLPFLRDPDSIRLWSKEFFLALLNSIHII